MKNMATLSLLTLILSLLVAHNSFSATPEEIEKIKNTKSLKYECDNAALATGYYDSGYYSITADEVFFQENNTSPEAFKDELEGSDIFKVVSGPHFYESSYTGKRFFSYTIKETDSNYANVDIELRYLQIKEHLSLRCTSAPHK